MDRLDCQSCNIIGGIVFCNYYDFMYNRCVDVTFCPEGLDEDEDWEGENNEWYEDNTDSE